MRYIIIISLIFLTACDSINQDGGDSSGEAAEEPTRIVVTTAADVNLQEANLLLWVGPGEAPGRQRSDAPGDIVLMNADGESETLMELPQGTGRVHQCTESATSPDGRYFSFFVGGADEGTLYLMDGDSEPQAITDDLSPLACLGLGTFQYTPDSSRFGYIAFQEDALTSNFPRGTLNIMQSSNRDEVLSYDNVGGFDLDNDQAAFISFFTDSQGEVREAAVFQWTNGNPDEIDTLRTSEGCEFRSGQIAIADADTYVAVMGQNCVGEGREWLLYVIDLAASTSNQVLDGDVIGSYSAGSRTGALYTAPDGDSAFFTYPNGLALNVVNMQAVDLDAPEAGDPIMTDGVMPRFVPSVSSVYDSSANVMPVISPDGRWLAVVSEDANGNAALNVIDLTRPDLPPLTYDALSTADTVSSMGFTPDSSRLLFVAGGHSANDNTLLALELASTSETRIIRGRYAPGMIVSPDGRFAALAEWQPAYLNLVVVNLENEESGTVFIGAEIVDGRVNNQQFVYPLSWRPTE